VAFELEGKCLERWKVHSKLKREILEQSREIEKVLAAFHSFVEIVSEQQMSAKASLK